jgi:oxygen-independent coproporphyrinogen-3 oxidase
MSIIAQEIPLALYVHWPWCVQKCPYCDFNSHQKRDADEAVYVQALLDDWALQLPALSGRCISSIFFGGGTPSLAHPRFIASVIERVAKDIGLSTDCEITLEANPGTVDAAHFSGYRAAGVNRLSLGIQSFDSNLLMQIGRIHDGNQAKQAIELARKLGFDNLNLDLMVGLPSQTEQSALADIETALSFAPEHLSHYQLTLEPNTPFFARPPQNLPDEDLADHLQSICHECLNAAGFDRYEVSAWQSKKGMASRHNLNYWQFGDYVGIGAGAHGKLTLADGSIVRTNHAKSPVRYVQTISAGLLPKIEPLLAENLPFEFLMNALRLREGINASYFLQRTGLPLLTIEKQWQQGVVDGFLEPISDKLVTTGLGYHYLNSVLSRWL